MYHYIYRLSIRGAFWISTVYIFIYFYIYKHIYIFYICIYIHIFVCTHCYIHIYSHTVIIILTHIYIRNRLLIRGAFWVSTVFASNSLDAWYVQKKYIKKLRIHIYTYINILKKKHIYRQILYIHSHIHDVYFYIYQLYSQKTAYLFGMFIH
jgi:hypothetical protein